MQPVRRDLDFDLPNQLKPEDIGQWHPLGPHVSHFFNALSLFFPEGERFFIHSVRHYRGQITDPALQQAISGFIGQEAMHGREHVDFNKLMDRAGLPASQLDRFVGRFLERVKARIPASWQLGVTLALEHFTAILAHVLLSKHEVLANANPRMADLWRWHALEETEHKAVAYDVYEQVFGRGFTAWLRRCFLLVATTFIFLPLVFFFHVKIMKADPKARGLRGWGRLVNFLFFKPGSLRAIVLPWLDYFRPSFHPWMHDNRQYLTQIDGLNRAYNAAA